MLAYYTGQRERVGAEAGAGGNGRMRLMQDKRNKLQQKYYVDRIDGRDLAGGDRVDSRYFVLDYIHDPYSIPALETYALACYKDFPNLSEEIRTLVAELKDGQPGAQTGER
jgi:hypothetical protein